jgi:hypothetical protein
MAAGHRVVSQLPDRPVSVPLHRAFQATRPSARRAPPSRTRLPRPSLPAAAAPWGNRAWTRPSDWWRCNRRRLQAQQLPSRCALLWVL